MASGLLRRWPDARVRTLIIIVHVLYYNTYRGTSKLLELHIWLLHKLRSTEYTSRKFDLRRAKFIQ